MPMLPVPAKRSLLPSLPVLGERPPVLAPEDGGPARLTSAERWRHNAPASGMAQAADSRHGRDVVHTKPDRRAGTRDGLRECEVPDRSECWTRRTATFMILGDVCTRPCGFCAVGRGRPEEVPADQPERWPKPAAAGLRHVVITSVTRDDLPDGGAEHFRQCVLAVRSRIDATIEVSTPDFDGRPELIDVVLSARPEVFNHNIETVARLQQPVRRNRVYDVSLAVLRHVKQTCPEIRTKSGLMLGLGETTEEILETLADLRSIGCDLLTLGQYLQPSPRHLTVVRYLPPDGVRRTGPDGPQPRFCRRCQRTVRPFQLPRG